jgi:hypothetical protein
MFTPEQVRERVLPYLYDLLDKDERQLFEATLEASAEARAILERARGQRQLLAEAVKDAYPEVTFSPPADTKFKEEAAPTVVLPRGRRQPKPNRLGWAVAAAILMVLVGGGGYLSVAGWVSQRAQLDLANRKLEQANAAVGELAQRVNQEQTRAQDEIREIQKQIGLLINDWNQEAALQKKVFNQKDVQVIIQSPRTLRAGANNSLQVQVKRNQKAPLPAKNDLPPLNVQVIDQTSNTVLFQKVLDTSGGQGLFNLELAPDLPVKPDMNLALEVFSKGKDTPIEVREHLTLAAPEYITHLYTDRPMYRPGETVRFRSLTLERFSLKPAQEDLRLRFRITDPRHADVAGSQLEGSAQIAVDGSSVKGPDGRPLRGIGGGEFVIPQNLAGGQYTLHVAEAAGRFPEEKRTFMVHQWQAPRFNKEITFDRSSYGPGDHMEITARGVPVEGNGPGPAGVPERRVAAIMTLTIDGQNFWNDRNFVDADGRIRSPAITLPGIEQMSKGQGIVSVTFDDGGNRETIVRPVPIVLGKVLVDFYPEGGDLVTGLANRVYFQATTATGKPADLQGRVVGPDGAVVAKVNTLTDNQEPGVNQGMGVFTFTPEINKKYELKIDAPSGMHGKDGSKRYVLPTAKPNGVVLKVPQGVVDASIDVEVTSADRDRQLLVGAYCRGKLLDHVSLEAKAGKVTGATLHPSLGIGGVYRVTVFEKQAEQFLPLAERLVYRPASERLALSVAPDKPAYSPGDRVRLALQAANEKRELASAVLLASVTDLSVHKLANDKTARAMPTHFLLTTEVRRPEDLENADFFLGNHPKARQALDLLLGVQGWRRFAEQDPVRFKKREEREAGRILQATGPGAVQTNDPEKEVLAKVDAKFAPRYIQLEKKCAEQEKTQAGDPDTLARLTLEQGKAQFAQHQISTAATKLEEYEHFLVRLAWGVLVIGTLLVGLVLLYVGMRQLSRGRSAAGFFIVGSLLLGLLFVGSLAGTFFLMGGRGLEKFEAGPFAPVRMAAKPQAAAVAMAPVFDKADVAADMDMLQEQANLEGAVPGLAALEQKKVVVLAEAVPPLLAAPRLAAPAAANFQPDLQDLPLDDNLALVPGGNANIAAAGIVAGKRRRALPVNNVERQLRQQGNFRELLRQRLHRDVNVPSNPDPFVVREYAHVRQPTPDNVRTDFAETLYWNPALVLDKGAGEIAFDLSDSATRFEVVVFGHTLDGRLGATSFDIVSRLPVSIEPTAPIEVTSSDTITLPITIANDQNQPLAATLGLQQSNLTLVPDPLRPKGEGFQVSLEGNKRVRELFSFQPAVKEGLATVRVKGDFGPLGADTVQRSFKIVPEGFPVAVAQSGLLENSASHEIVLPQNWVPGTLHAQVQVFPSTLAELQKGLEGLLREPNGCFEQSSSSNYPNVLILNYLKETNLSKPEVEKRARDLMTSGYAKLTSFECLDPGELTRRQGYEWFGQTAPPHEALTAYGLLQFKDMAKVYPVDDDMLARTRKYLLAQRDGKGGFKRNPRAIDSFGRASEHVTNAYIVWALTESGIEEDLSTELGVLYEKCKDVADPYFLALAGISHINQNKSQEGLELLGSLAKFQKDDGHLEGATTSITGSGGRDLVIETTALATLGWLKANRPDKFNAPIDKAAGWLGKQRGGYGGFGSTQSTILALKALIAHTRAHKKPVEAGNLSLFLGERQVAVRAFSSDIQEPLTLAVPDHDYLKPGPNPIRVQMTGRNEFPYTLSWAYQTLKPASAEDCPVQMTARLRQSDAKEGDTVRLSASVENKSGKGQGMTVAVLGLPGGLALPEDFAQLKELAALQDKGTKPGVISAWELRGRELVLYWRDLAPDAKVDVNLDLICRIPGIYQGPASRAYLYYNADHKFWADPLAITIHPAAD